MTPYYHGAAGALSEDGLSWSKTLAVSMPALDPDGWSRKTVRLRITDRYAGDNYKIQASFEPFAGDDPPNPGTRIKAESGTITAWKRIYVERDDMYRRGGVLFSDFTPDGDSLPDTIQVKTGHNLIVGDGIDIFDADHPVEMLAHEAATIQSITPDTGFDFVALDVDLQQSYNAGFAGGDKGAGVGVPAAGLFKPNFGHVYINYGEAFVEVLFPRSWSSFVPHMAPADLDSISELYDFADIWGSNVSVFNYVYVTGADNDGTIAGGMTNYLANQTAIFVQTVESGGDSVAMVCSHELGHQFRTNISKPIGSRHDDRCDWINGSTPGCVDDAKKCIMNPEAASVLRRFDAFDLVLGDPDCPNGTTCTEAGEGAIRSDPDGLGGP
jgi:hypothetical protein